MSLLRRLFGKNRWEVAGVLFVIAVDLVHGRFFEALNLWLRQALREPMTGGVLLLGTDLAFCVTLFYVGRLKPSRPFRELTLETKDDKTGKVSTMKTTWPKILFFYPSFGFGIILAMAVADVSGLGAKAPTLPENLQMGALLVAVGLAVAQLILGAVDVEPRYESGTPAYLRVLVPTVLVSELMLNLSTALWHRFLGPDASAPVPAGGTTLASFLVAVPLYLLFFAAPRFTFMAKSFSWPALASGLATALWALWKLLGTSPLA